VRPKPTPPNLENFPLVHGTSVTGRKYTCINAKGSHRDAGFGPVFKDTFLVPLLLVGAHITDVDGLRIDGLSLEFDGLTEWSGAEVDAKPGPPPQSVIFRAHLPALGGHVTVGATQVERSSRHAVTYEVAAHVGIAMDAPQTRESIFSRVFQFHALFSLLQGCPIGLTAVQAHVLGAQGMYPDARLVYLTVQPRAPRVTHEFEMLLPRAALGTSLGPLLQKWFQLAERLHPVIEAHFVAEHVTIQAPVPRFLVVAQALETLHRRLHDRTHVSRSAMAMTLRAVRRCTT
jgi:hypothetical protein